jgi:hypothetical protein
MDNQTKLEDSFATAKACEAMIRALKATVLVSDELTKTYNENLRRELKRLAAQNPELVSAFEQAIRFQPK